MIKLKDLLFENATKPLTVYHGTGKSFRRFNLDKTTQGIIWFTSNKNNILSGDVGAESSGYVLTCEVTIHKPAGWTEYDKYALYELESMGYDGAILTESDGFDCFVFDPGQVKILKTEKVSNLVREGDDGEDMIIKLRAFVSADQAERNEYKNFVSTKADGDYTLGAKLWAAKKKRPANDVFGDLARQQKFMKMTFNFDKFTDQDWDNYWMMSQHCDHDRPFQQKALDIIKQYLGDSHSHYKYLSDRISCGLKGTQKYSTQDGCDKDVKSEKISNLVNEDAEDYRGSHTAPDKTSGAPLHDLTGVYPDDIYSDKAARYYGDMGGDANDMVSVRLMQAYRNKPNAMVKIYRAVPDINKEVDDRIKYYNQLIAYVEQYRFPPIKDRVASEEFSDLGYNKEKYIAKLNKDVGDLQAKKQKTIGINSGDWVTLNRNYAIEHGKSALRGKYKIVSKSVAAKTLYTDANSVHEFGYDAS